MLTGLLTDSVMELIESGVVDRPVSFANTGTLAIGAVARGSAEFYRWADKNPALSLADARTTHAPELLVRQPKFVALNGALEVDLFGNANSLSVGGRLIGGLGGAIDYAVAGAYAAGSVIALEASRGGRSAIVAAVETPTVPALFVTHIVTEHGVARLAGLSLSERARAVIEIAAPEHRDPLLAAARAQRVI